MSNIDQEAILLTILGPTGVGKTMLANEIARRINDSVILSCDAMAVYKLMDIGTAKPKGLNAKVFGIDLVFPYEEFNLFLYKQYSFHTINRLKAEGKKIILTGGSALYLRSVIDDLNLPGSYPDVKKELESMLDSSAVELGDLYEELKRLDPKAASKIEPGNKRRIIRALEVIHGSNKLFSSFGIGLNYHPDRPYKIFGLKAEPKIHDQMIKNRLYRQLEAGFIQEVEGILSAGGFSKTSRIAHGYLEIATRLTQGKPIDPEDIVKDSQKRITSFVKRQLQWFRRDPRIIWFDVDDQSDFGQLADKIVAMI